METPDVLVTGSSGHLGLALMLTLPSHGYNPIGLDIKPSTHTTHVGSIADRRCLSSIFQANPTIQYIIHTATLHKPHVASHSKSDFIETNITGTLNLLELSTAHLHHLRGFIFTSTTSTFGSALSPSRSQPSAWITESTVPIPKNIYGTTKCAAEDLCYLHHKETALPVIVLKVSRFFPEADDDETARTTFGDDNLKVCELLYRRADIADMVSACVCAMGKAGEVGFGKFIVSGKTVFGQEDLEELNSGRTGAVLRRACPREVEVMERVGWRVPERIDRVYVAGKAVDVLGWEPTYTFQRAIEMVGQGKEWRSDLALAVGKRGYHDVPTGVYTS